MWNFACKFRRSRNVLKLPVDSLGGSWTTGEETLLEKQSLKVTALSVHSCLLLSQPDRRQIRMGGASTSNPYHHPHGECSVTGREEEAPHTDWENILLLTSLAFWKWKDFVVIIIVIYLWPPKMLILQNQFRDRGFTSALKSTTSAWISWLTGLWLKVGEKKLDFSLQE